MNNNDIELAIDIIKRENTINYENTCKKNICIWFMCEGRF